MSAAIPAAPDPPCTLTEAAGFFLGHGSPRILLANLAAAGLARLWVGSWSTWELALVGAIVLLWPLNEWLIHVFILHAEPRTWLGRRIDLAVARKHRAHHRNPRDLEILFIPLHSFAVTLPLLWGLAWVLSPTPGIALTFVAAYLLMALHYEWIHFLAHTPYRPRTAHYRRVLQHHRLHHFRHERYWYAVSMLGADGPLGTSPDPAAVTPSATCMTLGIEPERDAV
jgi:hypothetical protein